MKRQTLTDGTGRWFNLESATKFEEATDWNGNNHVSKATGSPHEHETLHKTSGGLFVLNHWSQWQGSVESWTAIDAQDAAIWLSINGHDADELCAEDFAALEMP